MNRNLEKLAADYGKVWVASELVFFVYDAVREMPVEAAIAHLQSDLSSAALASIQQAASSVVQRHSPDADSFGVGWVTPEAPVEFVQVPMAFVRHLASDLASTSSA